jgi:hypothetical protein
MCAEPSTVGWKPVDNWSNSLRISSFLCSIVQDCGYVFTKGPAAWAALPADYSCPPCGSIKRRFKKVPKGSVTSTNQKPAKKGW